MVIRMPENQLSFKSFENLKLDQYQHKTDARSGLVSDPNREGDEESIVRIVGRVTTVSLETQKLLAALPPLFGG